MQKTIDDQDETEEHILEDQCAKVGYERCSVEAKLLKADADRICGLLVKRHVVIVADVKNIEGCDFKQDAEEIACVCR